MKRWLEKAKKGTINPEISTLRRMFVLESHCKPPKVVDPPYITILEEINVRKRFFEYEDYQKLLKALPKYLKPVLIAAYHTGMRRGEFLAITWDQVNLSEGKNTLDTDNTKTGEPRIIYPTGRLYQAIAYQNDVS